MDRGAAQLLVGHGLVGDGFHHIRPGDIHVGRVLHHEDEVGDGGGVDVAAGTRAHDHGDLRYDTGGQRVLQEDVGIACQRGDPFLNAGPAGIENADHRCPVLDGRLLDLDDFLGVGLRKRAAKHREVLGEDIDRPAVDRAMPGDHAVAGDFLVRHAEIDTAVFHEHVPFLE